MRRLLTLAAFLLVISLMPVCAQRGGRGSASGSHGGFTGSHGGFAGHSGFMGRPSGMSHSNFIAGSHSFVHNNHFRGSHGIRSFRNRCFNCFGFGYPFYGAYYDPYWWSDSYSSYNEDDERERQLASEMNAQNLQEQRDLREQDQGGYERPTNRREMSARAEESSQNDPVTVLIFRDQRKREIQNYAIVGQTLWSFTPQRTEKIPLADLDIAATTKANDDRGVDFHLPRSGEGQ